MYILLAPSLGFNQNYYVFLGQKQHRDKVKVHWSITWASTNLYAIAYLYLACSSDEGDREVTEIDQRLIAIPRGQLQL